MAETIPDLLGNSAWFKDGKRDKGPLIVFPRRLEQTNWANLRASAPFASRGMWENETLEAMTLKLAHETLDIEMGMTKEELEAVSQFLVPGVTTQTILDLWE